MKDLRDKVAAITGAASGIGRMLAVHLADEGCETAIADINQRGLKETAEMIEDKNTKVSTHVVDVSDRAQVYRFADDVVAQHGRVNILINNAGVSISALLEEVRYEDLEWLLGVNLWGVIYGSKAFLPFLKQQPEAHIVNMSSIHGIITSMKHGPYCTSKFAIRGFTETLWQELKETSVHVSCVHPGGVKTKIVHNARFYKTDDSELSHEEAMRLYDDYLPLVTSERAARTIISGIKKDKRRILVGSDAYVYDWLKRLFPVGFSIFFEKLAAKKRQSLKEQLRNDRQA